MKVRIWMDSLGAGIASLLSAEIGEPVFNGAKGGDSALQVRTRFMREGAGVGGYNVIRCGHPEINLAGDVAAVLREVDLMVAQSADHIVCQLGQNSNGAYGTTSAAQRARAARTDCNAKLAAKYGSRYLPVQTLLCDWARARPGQTAQDLRDCDNDLLPDDLRTDVGNDGHMEQPARVQKAKILAGKVTQLGWVGGGAPAPAPVPAPAPAPAPAPLTRWERFMAWLRR